MSDPDFSRSPSLNNIPRRKFEDKIQSIFQTCPTCSKRDKEIALYDGLCQKCSLLNTAYHRYYESNIPLEYWNLKMEKDFKGHTNLLNKHNEIVTDIKAVYSNGTSVFFAGLFGLGKTMSCTSILKKAVNKGYTGLYTTLSDIVGILTQASPEDKYLSRRELTMVDFLVIDEVDIRFFSQSDTTNELFSRAFEIILRTRLQNKLPTFFATNSPNIKENFASFFKDSLNSLFNRIEIVYAFGDDFRANGNS